MSSEEVRTGSGSSPFLDYLEALRKYFSEPDPDRLRHIDSLASGLKGKADMLSVTELHHRALVPELTVIATAPDAQGIRRTLGRFCTTCPGWSAQRAAGVEKPKSIETMFQKSMVPVAEAAWELRESKRALIRLNEVREQEARRIAQHLHDEAAQMLAAVHLALDELSRDLDEPRRRQAVKCRELLESVETGLREISHELHPRVLDDLGLRCALEFLATGIQKRTGIQIRVTAPGHSGLPQDVETAMYRVVQEALRNVAKHSRAASARVTVKVTRDAVTCRIHDNGIGVNPDPARRPTLGLLGMRERVEALGGTLLVQSARGKGTSIAVRVPLPREEGASAPCVFRHCEAQPFAASRLIRRSKGRGGDGAADSSRRRPRGDAPGSSRPA